MSLIAAVLHTQNDALRLGRALETLYPCDEILVVDHGSRDQTVHLARDYGALVTVADAGASPDDYLRFLKSGPASPPWILCLDPRESLTESLAASLFEWKANQSDRPAKSPFSVFVREETADGWIDIPKPQTRLVPCDWKQWNGALPVTDTSAVALEGELLRFIFP